MNLYLVRNDKYSVLVAEEDTHSALKRVDSRFSGKEIWPRDTERNVQLIGTASSEIDNRCIIMCSFDYVKDGKCHPEAVGLVLS